MSETTRNQKTKEIRSSEFNEGENAILRGLWNTWILASIEFDHCQIQVPVRSLFEAKLAKLQIQTQISSVYRDQ